jgi:hypothetical protein
MSWTARLRLLAAALALVLVFEVAHAPTHEPPSAPAAAIRHPGPPPMPARSPGLRAGQLAHDVGIILARPLFSPSRRPSAIAPAILAEPPRLTGVIIAPHARLALFASTGGKVTAVAKGDSIAGYVVHSISMNAVLVSGPEGTRTLRTSFVHVRPHVIHPQLEASAQ